jgi:hypothetical protein
MFTLYFITNNFLIEKYGMNETYDGRYCADLMQHSYFSTLFESAGNALDYLKKQNKYIPQEDYAICKAEVSNKENFSAFQSLISGCSMPSIKVHVLEMTWVKN